MGHNAVFHGALHVLNGHFQGNGIKGRAVHLQELNGGDQQARLMLIDVHRNAGCQIPQRPPGEACLEVARRSNEEGGSQWEAQGRLPIVGDVHRPAVGPRSIGDEPIEPNSIRQPLRSLVR